MVVEKGIRMDTANGALRSVICRVEPGTKTNHYLTISLSSPLPKIEVLDKVLVS